MTDFRKSPGSLGVKLHEQFCRPKAVVPVLHDVVAARSETVKDYIGEQWGNSTGEGVLKSLKGLMGIRDTSVAHKDEWKFLLRVAQCAALADKQMQARLVPVEEATTHPKVAAIETIHDLGQRSLALLGDAMDAGFLTDPERTADTWDRDTVIKISQLGLRPHVFFKVMRGVADLITPERLSGFLEQGAPDSTQSLYRIGTAAAVVGQGLHVEFVPFV